MEVMARGARAVRVRAFTTTSSIWFCRWIGEGAEAAEFACERSRVRVGFFVDDRHKAIEWLRQHVARFPWIYIPEEIAFAEREGHLVVGVFEDDTLVSFIRVGMRRVYISDFRSIVRLPDHDVFVYDTFVLPEKRGHGLARLALMRTIAYLAAGRYRRVWCHIESWNRPSLRLYERAGFEAIARIRHTRVAGLPFFLRDGVVPMLDLEGFLRRSGPRRARREPGAL